MSHGQRFRDSLNRLLPWWLSDRRQQGKTVGFRFVWGMVAPLDALMDTLLQGVYAWFPGVGTPTALPWIGRARGIIRWQDEDDASYAARLVAWLDLHRERGRELELVKEIHNYLRSKPKVRIVNRAGSWITVNEDGSVETHQADWPWDTLSHPERNDPDAPWWSDLWIIVYVTTQWDHRPGTLGDLTGADGFALGHMASMQEVDALKGIIATGKGAHTRVRAVIWTSDDTLFDPENPASMPDGYWGSWGKDVAGSYVPARNTTDCRFWEPR